MSWPWTTTFEEWEIHLSRGISWLPIHQEMVAIKEYMIVGSPEQPTGRAVGEENTFPQMEKDVHALVVLS